MNQYCRDMQEQYELHSIAADKEDGQLAWPFLAVACGVGTFVMRHHCRATRYRSLPFTAIPISLAEKTSMSKSPTHRVPMEIIHLVSSLVMLVPCPSQKPECG